MLHNSHQLDRIISQLLDPRQNILRKLGIRANPALVRGYADMSFVDKDVLWLGRSTVLELILLGWVPETGFIDWGDRQVLSDTFDPSRKTFDALPGWQDHGYLLLQG
jgi:hypothetical protein